MKASKQWLGKHVDLHMDIPSVANTLTMLGLEVEAVESPYDFLQTIVVAKVEKVSPHPNADKLTCCEVNTGEEILPIVCGAPNVREGMLAPLATIGTAFPNGITIKASKLRGEASRGMLCGASELGLEDETDGLLELDSNIALGTPLTTVLGLGDVTFDISITPNRPDCLSIIGIARELAATQKTSLRIPEIREAGASLSAPKDIITIEEPELCPRYATQVLENIVVGPSPVWMQNLLQAVGIRPINNVVDITNFVMMEMGQPLHAFDYDRLYENRIVVKKADEGMNFTTLDGKERTLSHDMLLICDGKDPVAIAGVMGGLDSEINPNTKRVLIESAYFQPASVRKTARKLGLKTEAAHRYERGIDPQLPPKALQRTVSLLMEFAQATPITCVVDQNPKPHQPISISLKAQKTNQVLGTQLTETDITSLLESIEFTVEDTSSPLTVIPPSFRVDVSIEEDLIEEIARLYGYDHIVETLPHGAYMVEADPAFILRERSKDRLSALGFSEAINYCFIQNTFCDQMQFLETDDRRKIIPILNPLNEELAVMRTSLLPGLLSATQRNIAHQLKDVKLFETGKIFISNGTDVLPTEIEMLAGVWSGARGSISWHGKRKEADFFDLKGILEAYFSSLRLEVQFVPTPNKNLVWGKRGASADLVWRGQTIGQIAQVDPKTIDSFDIKQAVFAFEINLSAIADQIPKLQMEIFSTRYPASTRDITIVVDHSILVQEVFTLIHKLKEPFVEDVLLFDVYEGDTIEKGKKSLSFRIIYRSKSGTLEEKDILSVHQRISDALAKGLKASFH